MSAATQIDDVATLLSFVSARVKAGAIAADVADDVERLVTAVHALDVRQADSLTVKYLFAGAFEVYTATRERPSGASLRLGLETVRQALDRLRESEDFAETRPLHEVVKDLVETLPVSRAKLADLLGVHQSTIGRWLSERDAGPETDEMRKARDVARVVRQVRRVFTPHGTVTWLETPQRDLKSKRPVDLLGTLNADLVLTLASQARSQAAS